MVRIVALIIVAALAAAPAAASAAASTNPFTPPAQQQNTPQEAPPQQQPRQPAPQPSTSSGSISGAQGVMIAIAVVALIGGIWIAISRDARRVTAGRVRSGDEALGGRGGSATRAGRRSRKLSADERRRRKRGRAR